MSLSHENQASFIRSIVLFDGVCNLCNGTVNFIIDRDPKGRFVFAALQSQAGIELQKKHNLPPEALDSVLLIEGDRVWQRSGAALRIAGRLRWPWPFFAIGLIIPAFLRDLVYNFIARRRYRWFGKEDTCRLPTPELRSRFL